MKKWKPVLFAFCLAIPSIVLAADKNPIKCENGFYKQVIDPGRHGPNVVYLVDTKTQLCFSYIPGTAAISMTNISCESLAKRDDWKSIINWVGSK